MSGYLDGNLADINKQFWKKFDLIRTNEFQELNRPNRMADYYQRWSGLPGGFNLSAVNSGRSKYISVELIADNGAPKDVISALESHWIELRLKYLENLEWEKSDRKKTRIFEIVSCDIRESWDWERQCRWLGSRIIHLRNVFLPELKRITGMER
ncbi:MAG: DUF4268 domain-containing protein [Marinosulfonomonas sp.]|nr:DUF4268 domain-containing protein [Marinosulfonomonas sp.]